MLTARLRVHLLRSLKVSLPMDDEQNTGMVRAARRPPALAATISGVATGTVAVAIVALGAAAPWAIGVLIFQGPARWQASLARWALLIAVAVAVLGATFVWFAGLRRQVAPVVGGPAQAGGLLTAADLDDRASALLRRARDAIQAARSSDVCRAGLLDAAAYGTALAAQEAEIATALREQAMLRVARAELPAIAADSAAAELLDRQHQAAHLADHSIETRIAALEQLAADVRDADSAYRDWRALGAVAELADRHLDMLARTAADSHAIAEIAVLSQQARAVQIALRDRPSR